MWGILYDISILSDLCLRSRWQSAVNNISIIQELITHELVIYWILMMCFHNDCMVIIRDDTTKLMTHTYILRLEWFQKIILFEGSIIGRGERILTFPPLLTSRKNLFLVISKGFTKGFTPCPNLLLQRWDCWSLKVRLVYYHTRKTSMVYQILVPQFKYH